MRALAAWFRRLVSGRPHFVIGSPERPYLLRWWLVPRNRIFNVYLHRFLRDDDDRARHDHPWWSVSLMLRGGFLEILDGDRHRQVLPGHIVLRRPTHRHRVQLNVWSARPAWTLFITGPNVRTWGFWCPQGFVRWQDFTASDDPGQVGRGCEQ